MALTIAPTEVLAPERVGRQMHVAREWTLSGTYVTGGHAYSIPNDLGLNRAYDVQPGTFRNGTSAIHGVWDRTNQKVMFFWTGGGAGTAEAEVTNGTSLANYVGIVRAKGA